MITPDNKVQPPTESTSQNSVEGEPSACADSTKEAGNAVPPQPDKVQPDDCEVANATCNDSTNETESGDKGQEATAQNEAVTPQKLPNLDAIKPISPTTSPAETECKEAAGDSADVSAESGAPQADAESGDANSVSEVVGTNSQPNSPTKSHSEPQSGGTAVREDAAIDSPPQKTLREVKDKSAAKVTSDEGFPSCSVEANVDGSDEDSLSDDDEDIHVGRLRRRSSVSEEEDEEGEEAEADDYEDDFTDESDYSEGETMGEEFEDAEGAESELEEQVPIKDEKMQADSDHFTKKVDKDLSPPAHTVTFSAAIDAVEKERRIVDENKTEEGEQKTTGEDEEEENKKNPAYVPRSGAYYMHDVRNDASDEESPAAQSTTRRDGRRPGITADRWQHDRFDPRLQAPPTEKELIYRYGYNIRKHGFDEVPDTTPAAEATTTDTPDANTSLSTKPKTSGPRRTPRKKVPQGGASRSSGAGRYKDAPADSTPTDDTQAHAEQQQSKEGSQKTEDTRDPGVRKGGRSDRGKDLEVYPSAARSGNVRASFTRSSGTAEDSYQVQAGTSSQRTRTRHADNYDDRRATAAPRYNRGALSRRDQRYEEQYDGGDANPAALTDEPRRRPVDGPTHYRTPPGRDMRDDRRRNQRYDDAAHQNADDRRFNHDNSYRGYPNNNRTAGPPRNQNYYGRTSGDEDVNPKTRGNAVPQSSGNRHSDYYDDYGAPPRQHHYSDPRGDLRYDQRNHASANFRNESDDYQNHSGRRFNQRGRLSDDIRYCSGYRQDRYQPRVQTYTGDDQPYDDSYNNKPGYRPGRYGSRTQPSELKKSHYTENSDIDYDHPSDFRSERYQPRVAAPEMVESSHTSGGSVYQDRFAGRGLSTAARRGGPPSRRFQQGRSEEQPQAPTQRAKRYSTIRQTPNSGGPSGAHELKSSESRRPPPQTASPPTADRLPPVTQKTVPPEPQSTVTVTTSPPKSAPTPDSMPATEQASSPSSSKPPPTTSPDMQVLTSSMNAVRLGQPPLDSMTYSPVGLGGSFPGPPTGAQFASAGDSEMPPLDYYRSIDPAFVAAVLNQQHALAQAVNNAAMNGGPPLTPPQAASPSTLGGFPMSPAGDAFYGVATMPVDAHAIGQMYSVPPALVGTTPPFRPEMQPAGATGGRPILGSRPKRSLEVKDPSSPGTSTPPSSSQQVKAV